jgi:hypothetical protein
MRFVILLGAFAWSGCARVSTSDYGVAAGFAAAAGAVQVAEEVSKSQPAQSAGPQCEQLLVFCLAGTHSVCTRDATGCEVCSCTPDAKLDVTMTSP